MGFFCSVAQECERIGVRLKSLPFDWLITANFDKLLKLIENNFDTFLKQENLSQETSVNLNYYYDNVNDIHFYHDFTSLISLEEQIIDVKEKYSRRINRFYKIISEPTLFIRYISSQSEIDYLISNYLKIESFLKRYNSNNIIFYIINDDLAISRRIPHLFKVAKDKGDTVSRAFLKQLPDFQEELLLKSGLTSKEINHNIYRYNKKKRKKIIRKILMKIKNFFIRK